MCNVTVMSDTFAGADSAQCVHRMCAADPKTRLTSFQFRAYVYYFRGTEGLFSYVMNGQMQWKWFEKK